MARKRDKSQYTPKDLLTSFGIEKPPKGGVFTQSFWNEIRSKGVNPEMLGEDGFRPEAASVYFYDVEIARKSLSHDYHRLCEAMADFSRIHGFPEQPKRIAEMGCGAGMISLWLAREHPDAQV